MAFTLLMIFLHLSADAISIILPSRFTDAAERSRNLGFKGALSVHPVPIPYLNEGFSVPEQEARFMHRALEVFEAGLKNGTVQLAIAVESAHGVIRAYEIASSSSRIVTLSVGAEDLTQQIGVQISTEGYELWYARSKIIMDANAAGVQPLGLVGVDPFA
ncbi:aldolase/citrate lyase family protein, partial [Thermoproteota archaeon]